MDIMLPTNSPTCPPSFLKIGRSYDPGDQPPTGYLACHEWAAAQIKAGLRQTRCGRCALEKFPQELSHVTQEHDAHDRKGRVFILRSRVCNLCAGVVQDSVRCAGDAETESRQCREPGGESGRRRGL